MDKILLVYEDYADLMAVEAALKKVGFDVLGLSSEYAVTEQILAFNPALVVSSGRSGKVSSLGVGKRLKEMNRWMGKTVLIFPPDFKLDPQELMKIRADMILEGPITPIRLLQVAAKILGHDEGVLLERFGKVLGTDPSLRGATVSGTSHSLSEEEAIYVKGQVPSQDSEVAGLEDEERSQEGHFRFGKTHLESSTDRDESLTDKSGIGFDIDLRALENELLGGGVPEVERVPHSESELEELQVKARADIAKAQARASERLAKYQNIVKDVKLSPKSTVTRVEARRRAKIMNADLTKEKANEIDELRREFTKALFKK